MTMQTVSSSDNLIRSDIARHLISVDGSGISIGIISTSFNALGGANVDVENGDLPGNTNPFDRKVPVKILRDLNKDSAFATDEGRALAQIIHDVAPGSEILFHTAASNQGSNSFVSNVSFSEAVISLSEAGADIIFDDAILLDSLFKDGIAARAVTQAVNDGLVYLSSAGNNGSISYESMFRKGEEFSFNGSRFETHDFDPGPAVDSFQEIEVSEDGTLLRPLFSFYEKGKSGSASDLPTLLLLDRPKLPLDSSNVKAFSVLSSKDVSAEAFGSFAYPAEKDEELYYSIVREKNKEIGEHLKVKWVSTSNGLDRNIVYEYVDPLSGKATIYGQANAEGGIAVGSASNDGTEYDNFASRGGVPILFDEMGNLLPNPIIRRKPDVIGPDNVMTAFPEGSPFNPFIGTSAAVANVAGVVALMEQAAGGPDVLSPETIKTILGFTDKPVEPAPGLPSSAGLVQPDLAILGAKIAGQIASIFPDSDLLA